MAIEDSIAQSVTPSLLAEYYFSVEISKIGTIFCKEVAGLDIEFDVIEYRAGDMKEFFKVKTPGLRKSRDVILKKTIFKDDKKLKDWLNVANITTIKPVSVTVSLLDENGGPVKSWKLINAWTKKYSVEDFKVDDSSVLVETIVLAHEGVIPI